MNKILWVTNILFPEAVGLLTGKPSVVKGSGGWLESSAGSIISEGGIQLVVVAPSNLVENLTKIDGKEIIYYVLPCRNERKYYSAFEELWRQIIDIEKPEIIHIHGTEFSHGLALLRAKIQVPTVLSIQGLSEEIGYHFLDGMSNKDVLLNLSIGGLFLARSPFKQRRKYIKHGLTVEREMIKSVQHIIGRTSFDQSHVLMINPNAAYHKCNESLRDAFYEEKIWSYQSCQKHTIFLSQSSYSIKGLHQVLKAMPLILTHYPDTTIRIAGTDILSSKTLKQKCMRSTYANYIKRLIRKLGLMDKVCFTGPLDAVRMRDEYLKCNVFISPSSIENSPNSLGEAQILGVPSIGSYVGGTPDMIPNPKVGYLYRYSDIIMLASAVCKVFSSEWDSTEERQIATMRHNRKMNVRMLLSIYSFIEHHHNEKNNSK